MSQKSAKYLRKLIDFKPNSPREYVDKVVKTVAVPSGRLDANGAPIMNFEQRILRTNTGVRKTYQTIKRGVRKGV